MVIWHDASQNEDFKVILFSKVSFKQMLQCTLYLCLCWVKPCDQWP